MAACDGAEERRMLGYGPAAPSQQLNGRGGQRLSEHVAECCSVRYGCCVPAALRA